MTDDLAQLAISSALQNKWSDAIKYNLQILKTEVDNTEALNRLANAYFECLDFENAQKILNKVFLFDSENTIAQRIKQKIEKIKLNGNTIKIHSKIKKNCFIEEVGKTKIVPLLNVAGDDLINMLSCGDKLNLTFHNHKVSVETLDNHYIGKLPDDIAIRLISLKKNGNEYECYIRSINSDIKVFIKETVRSEKNKNNPSFTRETTTNPSKTSLETPHPKKFQHQN